MAGQACELARGRVATWRPASSHVATHLERKKGLLPQYGRKKSPTLALEPKWRTRHSAQGLRYCRVKALPNQPYMTHTNTFNLMKTFGYPTSIGRWGFQDQGGCTYLPAQAGSCVSSQCSCMGFFVHPNVLWFWSVGFLVTRVCLAGFQSPAPRVSHPTPRSRFLFVWASSKPWEGSGTPRVSDRFGLFRRHSCDPRDVRAVEVLHYRCER